MTLQPMAMRLALHPEGPQLGEVLGALLAAERLLGLPQRAAGSRALQWYRQYYNSGHAAAV